MQEPTDKTHRRAASGVTQKVLRTAGDARVPAHADEHREILKADATPAEDAPTR